MFKPMLLAAIVSLGLTSQVNAWELMPNGWVIFNEDEVEEGGALLRQYATAQALRIHIEQTCPEFPIREGYETSLDNQHYFLLNGVTATATLFGYSLERVAAYHMVLGIEDAMKIRDTLTCDPATYRMLIQISDSLTLEQQEWKKKNAPGQPL